MAAAPLTPKREPRWLRVLPGRPARPGSTGANDDDVSWASPAQRRLASTWFDVVLTLLICVCVAYLVINR